MDIRIRIYAIAFLLLLPFSCFAGTYYVSSDGTAPWSGDGNCTAIETPCSIATANTNAARGDTVTLLDGTYTITGNGIDPAHGSDAGTDLITYTCADGATCTITGDVACTPATRTTCASNSRGINLNGDSYVKVTKINFTNIRYGFGIKGGSHNEISYCTFGPARDTWADVLYTGTADDSTGHCVIHDDDDPNKCLYDADGGFPTGESRRVYNATRKSYMYIPSITSTLIESTASSDVLTGGDTAEDNKWHTGDTYQITPINAYDPAFCDIGSGYSPSTHNWIHHNTIKQSGFFLERQDGTPLFNIGQDKGTANNNNYNTIEYNHFYKGGHHVFGLNKGFYNVVRKNYMHNESWFSDSTYRGESSGCAALEGGTCGYRIFILNPDAVDINGNNLIEDNAIAYGDAFGGAHLADGSAGAGTKLAAQKNIYRYNDHFGNAEAGLFFGSSTTNVANDNRVYNNTFFSNGYRTGTDPDTEDEYRSAIFFYASGYSGNVIKNNLMYHHWSEANNLSGSTYWPSITAGNSITRYNANKPPTNAISNNYADTTANYFTVAGPITEQSDPLFTNTTLATNATEAEAAWSSYAVSSPVLTLQSTSKAIDGGTYLTTVRADDTSSGTSLILTDASYFQAGSAAATSPMGSSLSNVAGDYIKVGATLAVAEEVQITDINYTTNTLTINPAITRAGGEAVWLSRKSDGTVVLYNNAPDYGAHEYEGTITPAASTGSAATRGSGGTGSMTIGTGTGSITLQR